MSPEEIGYECEIQENTSIEEIRKQYHESVIIWISGSGESSNGDPGKYRCMLEYGGRTKYIEKQLPRATANQTMILGAIDAVNCVNKPMRLYLVAAIVLGFAKALKGKGVNCDLIQQLFEKIKEKNCLFTEVQFINGADAIKKYVYSCNPDKSQLVLYKKQKEDRKRQYKESIYRECIGQVEKILIQNGVDGTVLEEVRRVTPLVKASGEVRMKENMDIFDFEIEAEDMGLLQCMPQTAWSGEHPDFAVPSVQSNFAQ